MQAKADIRQEEKYDYAKLHDEITELEKRVRSETNSSTKDKLDIFASIFLLAQDKFPGGCLLSYRDLVPFLLRAIV